MLNSDDVLAAVRGLNPGINILPLDSPEFIKYGRIMSAEPFKALFEAAGGLSIPESGNRYCASEPSLEETGLNAIISNGFYGGFPAQLGACCGRNAKLNCLEWHKSEEINLAVTPFLLFLGDVRELRDGHIDSSALECFFVAQGSAYVLYQTALHFSPCAAREGGFICVVILPEGTNLPLGREIQPVFEEDSFLFMRNKWLIGHGESVQVREKGAFCGISGENLAINCIID